MLKDLQSKLPFLNKKKTLDELQEEDDDELPESGTQATGTVGTAYTSVRSRNEVLDEITKETQISKNDDSDAAKKKKRANLIRAVIVLAIVLLIAQEFFPEEPAVVAPVVQPRPKTVKKNQNLPTPEPTPAPVEAAPVAETTTEAPTEPTPETTAQPDITPIATVDEPAPTDPGTTTVAPEGEPSSDNVQPIETETISTDDGSTTDSISGDTPTVTDEDITEKMLTDLEKQVKKNEPAKTIKTEYVSPPDYEYQGRGLVYNCTGKHWACVDAPSYKSCENNSSSTKYLKKKPECYPFNIYESQRGCTAIQNRMVSSSAKTDFCNE